jgi:hypothetical protein
MVHMVQGGVWVLCSISIFSHSKLYMQLSVDDTLLGMTVVQKETGCSMRTMQQWNFLASPSGSKDFIARYMQNGLGT